MLLLPLLFFSLLTWQEALSYQVNVPYVEKYFDQAVDHFNFYSKPYGKDTYRQRYLVQDKWWSPGKGPIFFYTGNEADIVAFWNNTGFIFDIAPEFKALVIFAEHRYYGKSLPFGLEDSFKHPYVDLLTMEQALADFATLLVSVKEELNATNSPVISFGGSYGGMLSAYFRIKYPNVVDGALAASAPILLVSRDVPRNFFFQDVTKDFHDAMPGCDDRFREAFSLLQNLAAKGQQGLDEISSKFSLCRDLQGQADFQHLLGWIRNSMTNLAMFDYPYPTEVFATLPTYPVTVACEKILTTSDEVAGLATASAMYYCTPSCYDIDTEFIECSDPTGCGTGPQGFAWDYQACTELLMPAGTDNVTDMFPVLPFTLEQRETYCEQRWGVKPRLNWVKINLWGNDLSHTSNIIFSNGDLDPWHRGGVLNKGSSSSSIIALKVEGGAHHLDLRASNPKDPSSVIEVRKKEKEIISDWLQQAYKKYSKL